MNHIYIIYINRDEQEKVAASEIIFGVSISQLDSVQLATKVLKYKNAFPASKYNPILDNLRVSTKKDFCIGYFSAEDGFNEYGQMEVKKLTDLTNMFLGSQYVFVDFWATWCAPCLKELNYQEGLEEFLEENNIGVLYVSVDFGGNYKGWKETIINKNMNGLHYLATPELVQKFPYFEESSFIPRYILLDNKGNLLIDRCKFPSSGKLIPQLKEALELE